MRSQPVESFVVEAVKDELLPTSIPGFSPGPDFVQRTLEACPAVVTDPSDELDGLPFSSPDPQLSFLHSTVSLEAPTAYHGRSFEVLGDELEEPWQDEFGNTYSSINLKGNNFSEPSVIETATATDRLIAYGLQESHVIRRVLKASRILRENGIGTEYILGLAEPKTLPWPNVDSKTASYDSLPLPQYKRRLVEQYWRELPEDEKTIESLVDISSKFERMTFYITMRAMDTSFRLGDVRDSPSARQRVFEHINKYVLNDGEEPLSPKEIPDFDRYVSEIFAPAAAVNLAKLHSIGLAHRYPNSLNVTALGSIVDLDSVHGEPLDLDDDPITDEDIAKDVLELMSAIHNADNNNLWLQREKKNPYEIFAAIYMDTVSFGDDKAKTERLGRIMNAVYVLAEAARDDNSASDFGPIPMLLASTFEGAFVKNFVKVDEEKHLEFLRQWRSDVLPIYQDEIAEVIRSRVKDYSELLLDGYINELREPGFNIIGNWPSNLTQGEITFDWMVADTVSEALQKYRTHLAEHVLGSQDIISAEGLDVEEAVTFFTRYLANLHSTYDEINAWASEFLLGLADSLRNDFAEYCIVRQPEAIFPDYFDSLTGRSSENLFCIESNGVPLSMVLDYIAVTDEEVVVEKIYSDPTHMYTGDYVVTEDDSVLTEIVTDIHTRGMTWNEDGMKELSFDIPEESDYILFVEQKPDGSRRLRLQMKDGSAVELLKAGTDRSKIVETLHHQAKQLRMFDPSKFRPKPRIKVSLSQVILEEVSP